MEVTRRQGRRVGQGAHFPVQVLPELDSAGELAQMVAVEGLRGEQEVAQ
jgi:hypothetical protein